MIKKHFRQKNNKKLRAGGFRGFSLIEMLIVVFVFSLSAIALALVMKGLIASSNRIKKIQTAQANAQEAAQYFTKKVRMSEYAGSTGDSLTIRWRKPQGKFYEEQPDETIDDGTIEDFFTEDVDINGLYFDASGTEETNRVTMVFTIEIDLNGMDTIEIPYQVTASLRSYDVSSGS